MKRRVHWRALRAGARDFIKLAASGLYYPNAERAWTVSSEDFARIQLSRFRDIYNFARTHVPYYSERTHQYPTLDSSVSLLDFLRRLPTLPKETVRQHNRDFWPLRFRALASEHRTSGTTGTPLIPRANVLERGHTMAILRSWYLRICGTQRPRTVFLSGFMAPGPESEDLAWTDPLTGNIYVSIYSLSTTSAAELLDIIRRMNPQLIYGYASAVYQLARVIPQPTLAASFPKCTVVTTSEVLPPEWRNHILTTIGTTVHEIYGSQEGSHMALECEMGRFHIHPFVGAVEIVDERNNPVSSGESGKVLVTGLLRRSMPLFRYQLGDVAVSRLGDAPCPCGLAWPTIGRVEGRSEDLVRTRDGRRIGLLCFHATKELDDVREAQLVQRGYENFLFRLVTGPQTDAKKLEQQKRIRAELEKRLGFQPHLEFEYGDAAFRTGRGKRKAVVVEFTDKE